MNFQGRLGVICGGRASFVTDGRRVGRMDLVSSRKSLPLANKVGKLMFSQVSVGHSVQGKGSSYGPSPPVPDMEPIHTYLPTGDLFT